MTTSRFQRRETALSLAMPDTSTVHAATCESRPMPDALKNPAKLHQCLIQCMYTCPRTAAINIAIHNARMASLRPILSASLHQAHIHKPHNTKHKSGVSTLEI
jgi:ferredoxin